MRQAKNKKEKFCVCEMYKLNKEYILKDLLLVRKY